MSGAATIVTAFSVLAGPWAYGVSNDVSNMSQSVAEMREDMKEDDTRERDDLMRITRLEEKVAQLEEKDK